MSFLHHLNGNRPNNHDDIIHPLSTTLFTVTARTNWSISYLPGPSSLLTTTLSDSSPGRYYPFWLLILIAIFGAITSILTILGNTLVIIAFCLDRQIRQPTNYFILSLSVSDFLIGLLSMPLLTIYIYARDWPLGETICDIWLSLDYTVCLTSIYTVLLITIDRFCSVKMPAKYRKWRTTRKINIMIAITWAVPVLIFFSATMVYPQIQKTSNLNNGVCDVQWNKNHVFNLCLTIGYFWTTLFVMIVLYIFIYGVASNLEKKSRENARKMSSLVGMAGSAMTQIGVGIGVNKASIRLPTDKQNLTKKLAEHSENAHPRKTLSQRSTNNSSERRHTNDGGDEENSNSYESHSDNDQNNPNEKKFSKHSSNSRRGMSVNWGSNSTTAINLTSTRIQSKNIKSFAHSFYRNPIRLNALSPPKIKKTTSYNQASITLTPIPSEPELPLCRIYPPPQPRPESLAIMSQELFYERLKARQSPLPSSIDLPQSSTSINNNNEPSTSIKTPTDDITHSEPPAVIEEQPEINENPPEINQSPPRTPPPVQLTVESVVNNPDESSDDSWRFLNSNSSLDIPYIDETDFEDLGYILHRRSIPDNNSHEPIREETIVYKSPSYIKQKTRPKSAIITTTLDEKSNSIYEIYGNENDARQVLLKSPMFDSVELITYACTDPSFERVPIRHCSLKHVPRELLMKTESQSASLPLSSNDLHTTSSIIFISKTKTPPTSLPRLPIFSPKRPVDVERALIDFYQCTPINDSETNLTASESEILSNYQEISKETSSLLHLNERFSSAFIDDDYHYSCPSNLMKLMMMSKTDLETTSDEQTLTNSISLNTYSQDFSVDQIFRQSKDHHHHQGNFSANTWSNSSVTSSPSSTASQSRQIPQHLLEEIAKKRNASSDSDAITTTTTTTLTISTLYNGLEKRKVSEDLKRPEINTPMKKHHSDTFLHDTAHLSALDNRIASKVTFESFVTQNSIPSSPKMKDQSVMAQIDITESKEEIVTKKIEVPESEMKNDRMSVPNDVACTATTGLNSAKSSIRELLQSQKSSSRRKSKSQNRARKALRTITFILGAFVICWTPWHIYSAVHSLCGSCKDNWIFSNPMFHCFYFLCYLNSPINPFCYALANQQFRRTFTRILKLDLRRL